MTLRTVPEAASAVAWRAARWIACLSLFSLLIPGTASAQQNLPSIPASTADCAGETRIDHSFTNGARWQMCIESRTRENLVLKYITYTPPGGDPMPILATARLAQLHVAYDDDLVTYNDITQFGLGGGFLVDLVPQDCPGGTLLNIGPRAGICQTMRTIGDGYRSVSNAVEAEGLELFSVSQVGAYAYIQSWTFHDDGAIEPSIGATGALQRSSDNPSEPYGRVLTGDSSTSWLSHTHNYHWRLDFDLGAFANDDVVTETRHPLDADGRRSTERTRFDQEVARVIEPGTLQTWHIWEEDPDLPNGLPRGYAIEPGNHGHRFERTNVEPHTGFDFFVTAADECERFASQNARFNPDCLDHVLQYTNGESIVSEDVVLWHRVGFHHVPRNEDQRHMHSHWDGFVIEPVNLSRSNPSVRSVVNRPPVITALDAQQSIAGDAIELRVTASDADGDELVFGATNLPPGVMLSTDGVFTGAPETAGEWLVAVGVDDGREVVNTEFEWRVVAGNGETGTPPAGNPPNDSAPDTPAAPTQSASSSSSSGGFLGSSSGLLLGALVVVCGIRRRRGWSEPSSA